MQDKFYLVQAMANKEFDGHFSLFKFTTGWKGCFGTCSPGYTDDCPISSQRGYMDLEEALDYMIEYKPVAPQGPCDCAMRALHEKILREEQHGSR